MTADSAAAFVNRHIVSLVEQPSRRHPGNTGADDRDFFWFTPSALHRPTFSAAGCSRPYRVSSIPVGNTAEQRVWITVIFVDPKGDAGRIGRHAGRSFCR